MPVGFVLAGRQPMVKFVDPDRIDWRPGFFEFGLPWHRPYNRLAPFDHWSRTTAVPGDFSGVSLIFHVSRCGSTLLAQNLKATGLAVVLSEPQFMRILRTRLDGALSLTEAVEAVARVIGTWRDWAIARDRLLVIKLNSQAPLWHREMIAALPGATSMFLHREPLAVLESIDRKTPGYLQRESSQSRFPASRELDLVSDSPVLRAATTRYCMALKAFADPQKQGVFSVSYEELEARFSDILLWMGLRHAGASGWSSQFDSKATNSDQPRLYRAVTPGRLAEFGARHRALLDVATCHYQRFLESDAAFSAARVA